jgi:uncharacterized membrane protein
MPRLVLLPALARGWAIFAEQPLRLIGILLVGALLFLTVILAPMMVAGSYFVLGRITRGEMPTLGDLFAPFNSFERFLMGSLLWLAVQVLWLLFLGWIPLVGFAAALLVSAFFLLFMPFMVHQGLTASAALRACRELFEREWLMLLLLASLIAVLNWIGALALLLGLVVTLPYTLALVQAVYEQLYGAPAAAPAEEPTPAGGVVA